MDKNRVLIDSVDALENEIKVLRAAQEKFSHYTQEMVDKFFSPPLLLPIKREYLLLKWRLKRQAWA